MDLNCNTLKLPVVSYSKYQLIIALKVIPIMIHHICVEFEKLQLLSVPTYLSHPAF